MRAPRRSARSAWLEELYADNARKLETDLVADLDEVDVKTADAVLDAATEKRQAVIDAAVITIAAAMDADAVR